MATLKLRVSGMSCGHCQAKVAQALQGVAGVYSAIVNLEAGEAKSTSTTTRRRRRIWCVRSSGRATGRSSRG